MSQWIERLRHYAIQTPSSDFFFILRAALTTFPLVIIPICFPALSTTGNLRYLVSSSNLVAASRLLFSHTARGEEVITSPMTLPLVLLSSLCISWNVCRPVIMSLRKVYGEEMTTIHKSSENKWDKKSGSTNSGACYPNFNCYRNILFKLDWLRIPDVQKCGSKSDVVPAYYSKEELLFSTYKIPINKNCLDIEAEHFISIGER